MEKPSASIYGVPALKNFSCLADKCQDNCCHSWDMPVDDTTAIMYRELRPELASSVTLNGNNKLIMQRDQETGCCIKYEQGLCGIHAKYGPNLLSDACYFYPYYLWEAAGEYWQGATLSCPAMAELLLEEKINLVASENKPDRFPHGVKSLEVGDIEFSKLAALHFDLTEIILSPSSPTSYALSQLHSVTLSLSNFPVENWPELLPIYRQHPYAEFIGAEASNDQELQMLVLLIHLIKYYNYKVNERLIRVIKPVAALFGAEIDWIRGVVSYRNANLPYGVVQFMAMSALDKVLRRYVTASMVANFYPFAGQGKSVSERSWWLTIKFTIVRLATAAVLYERFEQDTTAAENWLKCAKDEELVDFMIDITQPLSRILDHLPDLELVQSFAYDHNWHLESRVNGLLKASVEPIADKV